MINRYDTWTKLKEVVVGDVNLSLCDMIDNNEDKKRMSDILYEVKDTLESTKKIFESFDIKVQLISCELYVGQIWLNGPVILPAGLIAVETEKQ